MECKSCPAGVIRDDSNPVGCAFGRNEFVDGWCELQRHEIVDILEEQYRQQEADYYYDNGNYDYDYGDVKY